MHKKGQAALEFLMTYGWAILVVLIVIGALAYFGVLNPNLLVPEKCTLVTGLNCKDFKVTDGTDTVNIALENGLGKNIYVTDITFRQVAEGIPDSCRNATGVGANIWPAEAPGATRGGLLSNGASRSFSVVCVIPTTTIQNKGRKVKLSLNVSYWYTDSTVAFTHIAQGEMLALLN
jgi:hypothetical protein